MCRQILLVALHTRYSRLERMRTYQPSTLRVRNNQESFQQSTFFLRFHSPSSAQSSVRAAPKVRAQTLPSLFQSQNIVLPKPIVIFHVFDDTKSRSAAESRVSDALATDKLVPKMSAIIKHRRGRNIGKLPSQS